MLSNLREHDAIKWSEKYDIIRRVVISIEVTVLVYLKRLGAGTSLRDLEDGTHMGKETLCSYMMSFLHDIKQIYGAT